LLALLEFRNTPSESLQLSPVQIIFGWQTRSLIPIHSTLLQTESSQQTHCHLIDSKAKQTIYYNRKATSARPPLEIGQTVHFKPSADGEWRKGEIVDKLPFRSYRVQTPDGSTLRSTSRHVRLSVEPPTRSIADDRVQDAVAAAGRHRYSETDITSSVNVANPCDIGDERYD